MTVARQNEAVKLAKMAIKVVDYINKVDQTELTAEIEKIRNKIFWRSYLSSFFFTPIKPVNQSNLEIAKDIFKDKNYTANSVNGKLLQELAKKSKAIEEGQSLNQTQIETLNSFVHEKIKFETQKKDDKKVDFKHFSLLNGVEFEQKKASKLKQAKEPAQTKTNTPKNNSQLSKLLNLDELPLDTNFQVNKKGLDKHSLFSNNIKKNKSNTHHINQPVSRGYTR